jgi:CheY-like chemotaxis protein
MVSQSGETGLAVTRNAGDPDRSMVNRMTAAPDFFLETPTVVDSPEFAQMQPADGRPVVLLADDDEDIVRLVSFRLDRSGFRVIAVRNGAEAVELANELNPAVVILDVSMPGLTGLEATRVLRASAATAGLPILLLTARTTEADVAAGQHAGATAYLTKPFSPQELARRVEELVPHG